MKKLKTIKRYILRAWYKTRNHGDMLIYHHMYGKFKVQYNDGAISQPFSYKVAKDYAEMFGGKVIDNF